MSKTVEEYLNEARKEFHLDNLDKANKLYDKAIGLDKKCKEAYFEKGACLYGLQKYNEAIKAYDEAIEIDKEYKDAYFGKGVCLDVQQKYNEAIKIYNEAIEIDKEYKNAYLNKGICLSKLDRDEDAIIEFNKAIEIDKNFKKAYINKGASLSKLDRDEDAIILYNKVVQLDDQYRDAYVNKGNSLIKLDRCEEGINQFDKAIEIDKNYKDAYYNKGVCLFKLARKEEAVIEFANSMKLEEDTDYYSFSNLLLLFDDLINQKNPQVDDNKTKMLSSMKECIQSVKEKNYKKELFQSTLYQYIPYDKNAIHNILQESISFSNPQNFNDPFDPPIKIFEKEVERNKEGLMARLNFRITCLTTNNKSILMWSHYAQKHTGACIAYDTSKLETEEYIFLRKVQYGCKISRPKKNFKMVYVQISGSESNTNTNLSDDPNNINLLQIYSIKDENWNYEKEYRLIYTNPDNEPENFITKKCPITAIYLGYDMPSVDKDFIIEKIKEKNRNTKAKIKVYETNYKDDDICKLKYTLVK